MGYRKYTHPPRLVSIPLESRCDSDPLAETTTRYFSSHRSLTYSSAHFVGAVSTSSCYNPAMAEKQAKYYVTSAIPYVNAKPHLGHVLEWFQADVMARYNRLQGKEVAFICGADENSLKNVQAAEKAGKDAQAWLDEYAGIFQDAFKFFNISLTNFRRGSDKIQHWPGVQELWKRCQAADDIYQQTYTGLYCVGCESFYTSEDLIDGKCPNHLTVPETVSETNYFFRLSKYADQIEKLIKSDELKISSEQYKNEMLAFIQRGLVDFSVSRSVERARGVGVPVPDDSSQVMYVWFDALSIYMTGVGWGYDQQQFEQFWPADLHVIGKDITRFHAIYWIGMLLSAKLPVPKQISVHGFLTAEGRKMSKSLGNVIDPFELVKEYGLEQVRYYLLKEIPTHADGDFSTTRFKEIYLADLANGIGNLCSRLAKLCSQNGSEFNWKKKDLPSSAQFRKHIEENAISEALQFIRQELANIDQELSTLQPWKLKGEEQRVVLQKLLEQLNHTIYWLQPFTPTIAEKILTHFATGKIEPLTPLFPRLT